ncbi:OmpH family outer membrane protein [Bryocella elongata]|nr:OmpH family outer membrane protein [Bryocella elongata]
MNRTFVLVTALAAGIATLPMAAQTAAPAAPAASQSVEPQAIPAKIAIIAFEQVVFATNEGQKTVAEVQKKYDPKKAALDQLGAQIDALRKQEQALPATTTDAERAKLLRDIDTKEKQAQLDGNEAQEAYGSDLNEAMGKVAQKVGAVAVKYAQDHGFTMVVNSGVQQGQSQFLWWQPSTDISQAVVNAYNTSSGVAAPAPSAPRPAASRPAAPAPKK